MNQLIPASKVLAHYKAKEAEKPISERWTARTVYERLCQTRDENGSRPAITFQLMSTPASSAETLTWSEVTAKATQMANMLRSLGIGENDVVAYILPTTNETAITLLGGLTAGIVSPINPLLENEQIAAILQETGAKVVVTLKSFPKTDLAQKTAAAVAMSPNVKTIIEIDLLKHVTGVKKFIAPLLRPKTKTSHNATVLDFEAELAKQNADKLDFQEDVTTDRFCANFHTGGTTGMPKVVQHRQSGILYNGFCGDELLYQSDDVVLCGLPLFHVFAAYPILSGCFTSGAHMVMPTPAGFRGDGVMDNFWKLVESYKATFIVIVPTAAAALMQKPIEADVSTLKSAFCGSAPLPVELYKRFESATNVNILEGYGLSEATCIVSCNPVDGEKKIGSVGVPMPHTDVKIFDVDDKGKGRECKADEVGEICISNPGVAVGETYTDASKNEKLYANDKYLRTGDLGRIDADGYIWITGRAKDLIIRGGHNIDPALIEEALAAHEKIAFAGAIGQPDAKSGELPCCYVELVEGATMSDAEILAFAEEHVHERAAIPKYVEVLPELPKTAVGKVFKPALRKMAITRMYNEALESAGMEVRVADVIEDKKRGLVAHLAKNGASVSDEQVTNVLGAYIRPWQWAD